MALQVSAGAASSEERFGSFEKYARLEDTEQTCATSIAEDIVLTTTQGNDQSDDGGDEPPCVPLFLKVLSAIYVVRNFVETNGSWSGMMYLVAHLERTVTCDAEHRTRQAKMSEFFHL